MVSNFGGVFEHLAEDVVRELPETERVVELITSEPIEQIDLEGLRLVEYEEIDGLVFAWWKEK